MNRTVHFGSSKDARGGSCKWIAGCHRDSVTSQNRLEHYGELKLTVFETICFFGCPILNGILGGEKKKHKPLVFLIVEWLIKKEPVPISGIKEVLSISRRNLIHSHHLPCTCHSRYDSSFFVCNRWTFPVRLLRQYRAIGLGYTTTPGPWDSPWAGDADWLLYCLASEAPIIPTTRVHPNSRI